MKRTEDAFSKVVDSYGPLVWRNLSRLLGEDDSVAEGFQETFLEFLRVAKRSSVEHPGALLMRIASRRAIDRIRWLSARRRRSRPLEGHEPDPDPAPSSSLVANELRDSLRAALATLPEMQSAVFVMTQFEQIPHDTVATALGVSVNHVGVLLYRARESLQKKLPGLLDAQRR